MMWKGGAVLGAVFVLVLTAMPQVPVRAATANSSADTAASQLMDYLLQDYDPRVRPVANWSDAVEVRMNIAFFHVQDVDVVDGTVRTNVWLRSNWFDEFLNWEPSDWQGITFLAIPRYSIWRPDIELYNTADRWLAGVDLTTEIWVWHDGSVYDSVPAVLETTFKVDISKFPFDSPTMDIQFGSWVYSGLQMDLKPFNETIDGSGPIDIEPGFSSTEYKIKDVTFERVEIFYPCCPNEPWPLLTWTMKLERYSTFFITNSVVPLVGVAIISMLVVWINPKDTSSRMGLTVTSVLTIVAIQIVVSDFLPQAKQRTWLDRFSQTIFGCAFLIVTETAVVAYWLSRKDLAPPWCRVIVLWGDRARRAGVALSHDLPVFLSRICCYCCHTMRNRSGSNGNGSQAQQQQQQQQQRKSDDLVLRYHQDADDDDDEEDGDDGVVEMRNVIHTGAPSGATSAGGSSGRSSHQHDPLGGRKVPGGGPLTWIRVARALDRIFRILLPTFLSIFVLSMLILAAN